MLPGLSKLDIPSVGLLVGILSRVNVSEWVPAFVALSAMEMRQALDVGVVD
jgi:hypothetical protein